MGPAEASLAESDNQQAPFLPGPALPPPVLLALRVSQKLTISNLPAPLRLRASLPLWELIKSDPWVLEVIKSGYQPTFNRPPPLTSQPQWFVVTPSKAAALRAEIDSLLSKQVIEPVSNQSSPGFYSRIFLVPKKTGKLRPVIDLSPLNRYLVIPKFRMLTSRILARTLPQGHWAASLDLKDAYFHIPIRRAAQKYLRFAYQGTVYQFLALPFGISTAPYVFTRVASQLARFLQPLGIPLPQYIDDWLTHAQSSTRTGQFMQVILQLTKALGWLVNLEKSDLIPTQHFTFIGVVYDLQYQLMFPRLDRYLEIQKIIRHVLLVHTVSLREWQSLLGHLQSLADQVPLGRLHTRPLHQVLASRVSPVNPPDTIVPFSTKFIPHLEWWLVQSRVMA